MLGDAAQSITQAKVAVDGLGDLVALRIAAPGVPPQVTARISAAVLEACRAASREHAQQELESNPAADDPEVAARMRELTDERFGPPADTPAAQPSARPTTDDDEFAERSHLARAR